MINHLIPLPPHAISGPIDIDPSEILQCQTIQAAFRLSFNRASTYRSDEQWAAVLGISPGAFHAILYKDLRQDRRVRHIPDTWFEQIALITGNNAVGQWIYSKPQQDARRREIKHQEQRQLKMEGL